MSIIEIEITDDSEFNKGWLMYLLGMDRPDDDDASPAANGWDMGKETPDLKQVRHVFTRQHDIDKPQFVVREVLPETGKTPDPVDPRVTVKPKRDGTISPIIIGE